MQINSHQLLQILQLYPQFFQSGVAQTDETQQLIQLYVIVSTSSSSFLFLLLSLQSQ
jgi:hypothetical protein